jgi:DnaJ-class molecular chaperone
MHRCAQIVAKQAWFRPVAVPRACFSSSRSKEYYKLRQKDDPFHILGLSKDSEMKFGAVKKIFLRIAMKHHPDTAGTTDEEKIRENREIFIDARKAFEAIVEGPDGIAILRSESDQYDDEEEFDNWFRNETGHDLPFMDAATMKEVAEMTETVGGGLDRDGGMVRLIQTTLVLHMTLRS